MKKHGHAPKLGVRSPEYIAWRLMRQRCSNRATGKNRAYYFARGIRVCEAWDVFVTFLSDMGPRPGPGFTLDRIDNDGNYEPGNVKWSSSKEQNRNRRDNVFAEFAGEMLCLAEIAERSGLTKTMIHRRYHQGKRGAALVQPPQKGNQYVSR